MSGRRQNYSEVDELNRILMVERELVLKTQENYRILKEKFLSLSKEHEHLRKEQEKWAEGAESREKLQELEGRSDELIKIMRQANQEREVRYEKFKVDTIEELQNVYRKELQDQNNQIDKLRIDRQELVKENDQLLEEIAEMSTKMDDYKRKEKAKEVEMRMKYDQKLKDIVMNKEKRVSPRFEHLEHKIEDLHAEIQKKEELILLKSRQFASEISLKNGEIEDLKRSEAYAKSQISQLEDTVKSLKLHIEKIASENDQTVVVETLRLKNEELLKENLNLEMKQRQEQLDFARQLADSEETFSVRISEFEKLCEQKDLKIEDLHSQLEKCDRLQESLEKADRSRQIEEEHRERLELEVKSLYEKLQKSAEDRQKVETTLKLDRDRLEVSLVTMKKKLESTPEAPENVEKLRKELRDSEKRRLSEKEKHQAITSELKSALKRLERSYRDAVIKLQEKIPEF
ncbi:Cilia- and flagella-associated protein 157 [Caenorhabditis elegans]|uniref:Cilia- and flagella-associated protein 157 n=1 Tax=Caenorhabditis elegans TaxID=6239 RepID=O16626_CAEEL|nr:Cilia- and flagella-associated protein 157 [Caenorhabditis elegans]CCD72894.1 Cilia- and flagella-associated protein 157 [Caenorhabditis elegans]|eukprot:NP_494702.2 Uncharacterized protein CELE_K10G6.4 [Caenorhabditis elegans]